MIRRPDQRPNFRSASRIAMSPVSADISADTIVDDTICRLQERTDCRLSGDDSNLQNVWAEICVQMQGEESVAWDAYVGMIDASLLSAVDALKPVERQSLWLETEGGLEWQDENEDDDDGERAKDRTAPVDVDEIVNYLKELLLAEAADFENDNIRRFLDRDIDD
jgi:hypothetical protein